MASNSENGGGLKSLMSELPIDKLKGELQNGLSALGSKAVETAGGRLTDLTGKLTGMADGGGFVGKVAKGGAEEAAEGGSPVKGALKGGLSGAKDKVKEKLGGGGGGKGDKGTRSTNIIEEIDVGVPLSVAYNQWTQFQDYSNFMKKVESVEQEDDTKVNFKAQVLWSHRTWQATILEQVPDEKIIWRSQGEKGHVNGAVTFHELAPNLTRILVVLEYFPQGLFERTGNLWRAQGRRARLELKHFRRHVMTEVLQNPDEVEGWRGEIEDGEVVRSHEEVVEEEQQESEEADEGEEEEEPEDELDEEEESEDEEESEEEPEDELDEEEESEDEEEPEDELEEESEDEEESEEEPEDELDEDEEEEDEEPEDELDEDEEEEDEEPEDELDEDEEEEDEEPEDELDEEEESEEEEEPDDEVEEEEPEAEEQPPPRRRRRRSS